MAELRSVCAGAKRREGLYLAFENIYPVLRQYRKGDAAPHKPRKQQQKTLPVRCWRSDTRRHLEPVVEQMMRMLMQCAFGSVCDASVLMWHSAPGCSQAGGIAECTVRLQAGPSAPAQLGAPAPQLQLTGSQQ